MSLPLLRLTHGKFLQESIWMLRSQNRMISIYCRVLEMNRASGMVVLEPQ